MPVASTHTRSMEIMAFTDDGVQALPQGAACSRVGFSSSSRADAIRNAAGMQARNTPLSDAVVRRMLTVSAMKYTHGLHSATRSSGLFLRAA